MHGQGLLKCQISWHHGNHLNALLELAFPELCKFSQPLSGIIAGRKKFFEKIEFEKDYGVDIGILLDMVQMQIKIKEVHIGKIKNNSQQWKNLEKMSREVMNAIIRRSDKVIK